MQKKKGMYAKYNLFEKARRKDGENSRGEEVVETSSGSTEEMEVDSAGEFSNDKCKKEIK